MSKANNSILKEQKEMKEWFKDHKEWSSVKPHISKARTFHATGDVMWIYKDGNVFGYNKQGTQVDKFSPSLYKDDWITDKLHLKADGKDSLKKVAKLRTEQTNNLTSKNGKDVTKKSGLINPQVKVFELGEGKNKKYIIVDPKTGSQVGRSSPSITEISKEATNYNTKLLNNNQLEEDQKIAGLSQKNLETAANMQNQSLADKLEKEIEKRDAKNKFKTEEIIGEPKEAVPDIDKEPSTEASEEKSLWDTIKDNISGIMPTPQEDPTPREPQPSKNPLELLKEQQRNPDTALDPNTFRQLENEFRGEENTKNLQQGIKDKQGARRQTLGRFDERLESSDSLVDRLENYTEGVSEELKDLKGIGSKNSAQMQGMMPGDDFKLDWGVKPTFENSRDIWDNEFAPNYKYSSDKPFNKREYQLGLSGHAGGSAVDSNQREKMGARSREELENMAMIQEMLLKQQGARGVDISDVQNLGKAGMDSYQQGLDAESNIMNPILNQEQRAREQGDDIAKSRAEAETNLTDSEMMEDANLYDFLEQQRQRELADLQREGNLEADAGWAKGALMQANQMLSNQQGSHNMNIWVNRQNTYAMLESLGIQREQIEALKQSEGNKNQWAQLISGLLQTAGTVAGAYYGGTPGAALGNEAGKKAGEIVSKVTESKKDTYGSGKER